MLGERRTQCINISCSPYILVNVSSRIRMFVCQYGRLSRRSTRRSVCVSRVEYFDTILAGGKGEEVNANTSGMVCS